MKPTKDQLKDLRPFTANEWQAGGHHYLKRPDGSFEHCCIDPSEIADPNSERTKELREFIREHCAKGLLFVRINAPWKRLSE